jgi:membrane protease YdiL (CAAX protease family)
MGRTKTDFNYLGMHLDEQVPWHISDVIYTYVLIFVVSLIFVGIFLYASIDANLGLFTALLQLAISLATLGIVYAFVSVKYQIPFKEAFGIYFHKTPSFLRQGIFAATGIILSTTVISFMFSQFSGGNTHTSPYVYMPEDKIKAIIFLAVCVAPIVEEIFFRGFMQPALVKTIGASPGILLTALIFGFSHTQYLEYNAALVAVTTIGLILGITKYYTNSVVPGIFAHLFNNLLAAVSLLSIN